MTGEIPAISISFISSMSPSSIICSALFSFTEWRSLFICWFLFVCLLAFYYLTKIFQFTRSHVSKCFSMQANIYDLFSLVNNVIYLHLEECNVFIIYFSFSSENKKKKKPKLFAINFPAKKRKNQILQILLCWRQIISKIISKFKFF